MILGIYSIKVLLLVITAIVPIRPRQLETQRFIIQTYNKLVLLKDFGCAILASALLISLAFKLFKPGAYKQVELIISPPTLHVITTTIQPPELDITLETTKIFNILYWLNLVITFLTITLQLYLRVEIRPTEFRYMPVE